MKEGMKPVWESPELVILERSRPEESVLDMCKSYSVPGTPQGVHSGCKGKEPSNCGQCKHDADS